MNVKSSLSDGLTAGVGKSVVSHLESARKILLSLEAEAELARNELSECERDIFISAVRVAGIFCGGSSARDVVEFLSSCGVSVPEEFVKRREKVDEWFDRVPGVMPE